MNKQSVKKLISYIVVITCIFTIIPVNAVSSNTVVYANDTFEQYVTNSIQSFFEVSGPSDVIIKDVGMRNKAVMVNKKSKYSSELKRSFPTATGNVVFQFDMKNTGAKFPIDVVLSNSGGLILTPLSINSNFEAKTYNGKYFGGIPTDNWINIAIIFNPEIKRYSIYLNRKAVLSNWCIDNLSFNKPTSISVSMRAVEDGESTVFIDNFRIYEGEELKPENYFGKSIYNPESTEYKETVIEEDSSIVQTYTYDNAVAGVVAAKNNIIEWREEEGNGYVHMEENSGTDAFIDYNLGSKLYYVVYSIDIRSNFYSSLMEIFTLKLLPDNSFCFTLKVSPGGKLVLYNGKQIATLKKSKWHRIAVAYDFLLKKFDVYVDNEIAAENIPMEQTNKSFPSLMRFRTSGGNDNDFDFDNLLIYGGKEPRQIFDKNSISGYPLETTMLKWKLDNQARSLLGEAVAYNAVVGSVYANGEKTYPEIEAPYMDDRIVYIPLIKTANLLGKEINETDDKYTCEDVSVSLGSDIMTSGDKTIALSAPITKIDDTVYVPSDAFSKTGLFGESVFTDLQGIVIFGKNNFSKEQEKEIIKYMQFRRPTAQQILNDYESSNLRNVHPRILATQSDFDRIKKIIETDENAAQWYDKIVISYKNVENMPVNIYKLQDGDRLLPVATDIYNRVVNMSFIYKITGDTVYAERAYKELEAAAAFPDWHPSHFLDTAKLSQAIAIGYDWLYDYLTEEKREVLEKAMIEFGFSEYLKHYTLKTWWTDDESNWTFICNSGALMIAMALIDKYPAEASHISEIAIKGMEDGLYNFAPDGAWYEGPGYWEGTMQGINMAIATLETSLGKDYDLTKVAGFDKTIDWVLSLKYNDTSFVYGDSSGGGAMGLQAGMWMGYHFNNGAWQVQKAEIIKSGLIESQVTDLLWYIPEMASNAMLEEQKLDSYYRNVEIGSTRSSWSGDALYLAYKGGQPGNEGHTHLDSGTFSLYQNGICWAKEFGYDNYNGLGYYNFNWDKKPNRWTFYRTNTQGHNCIVINPFEESNAQEQNAKSNIIRFESKPKGSIGVIDLSDAYGQKSNGVERGYMLTDDRRSAIIRDEIDISGSNNEIYWFMHTNIKDTADFSIEGNHVVMTDESGKQLYLEFTTNAATSELLVMDSKFLEPFPASTEMRENPEKKVAIKLTGTGNINLTVKMYDNGLQGYLPPVEDKAIKDWTIPDGQLLTSPYLKGIYANEKLVENFSKFNTNYHIYPYYDQDFPNITADASSDCIVEIDKKSETEYCIRVSDKNDRSFYRLYNVKMRKVPYIYETLDGYTRLKPVDIIASDVPQEVNAPENVDDNNFSSRFSVEGDNQWIQLDYGKTITANAFAVAFYSGKTRISYYDILISEDGVNYTTIFEGETTGLTDYYEVRNTGEIKLRYLKFVGHGNSAGPWNSASEIALLKEN